MNKENEENNKVLICGCSSYNKNQKNGILLVKIQLDDTKDDEITEKFLETPNFQVHCFCHLFKLLNKNDILEIKMKEIKYTDYFFVAGKELKNEKNENEKNGNEKKEKNESENKEENENEKNEGVLK